MAENIGKAVIALIGRARHCASVTVPGCGDIASEENVVRLIAGALCTLLASCTNSPGTGPHNDAFSSNSSRAEENQVSLSELNDSSRKSADVSDSPGISPTMAALFDLPESDLRTACSAASSYPDHRVRPAFYDWHRPPEFERYAACLLAEARRDGGRVRLASASSFPRIGACYLTRITDRSGGYNSVRFDNGLSLSDYGYVPWIAHSRIGDRVRACVHHLPEGCPSYDLRGIDYRLRNLRTGRSWVGGDSLHMCRGA